MSETIVQTETSSSFNASLNANLNYYLEKSLGGHDEYQIGVASYFKRNFDVRPVSITDIRGTASEFTLDKQGFQYVKSPTKEHSFDDPDRIRRVVYPETEELLKKMIGASRVHVYSHVVRRDSRAEAEKLLATDPKLKDGNAPFSRNVPVRNIHVDFSEGGAHDHLQKTFDAETAAELSKTRWG